MRKTILALFALFASLHVFAGGSTTKSYSTSASFGTSPSCMGKGICGTGAARGDGSSVAVTFTYNSDTHIFKIIISNQELASKGITAFNGPTYMFEQIWTTPGDVANALNNGTPFTVAVGVGGLITDDGTNKTVTYTIVP